MAKYLLLFRGVDLSESEEKIKEWDAYIGRLAREGKFLSGLPFGPSAKLVTGTEGNVMDLTKNEGSIAAYIIVRADSLDDAVELAKKAPNLSEGGTVEVRSTIPPVQ